MSVEARALVLVTAVLMAFGLAVLYSASSIVALNEGASSARYLLRQLTGVAAGCVAFAILAKTDAQLWNRYAWHLMLLSMALMLFVVLPFTVSLAPEIRGSRRFILGGAVQPAELAKLAVIIWTSMLVVKKGEQLRHLLKGLVPFLVVVGGLALLAAYQPDLSMSLTFLLIMLIILYAGDVRVGHFIFLGLAAIPLLWDRLARFEYAIARWRSFVDPESVSGAVSHQLNQSLIAVGSGGLFGTGYGQGIQQFGYLPLGHNDFIGSIIGEEFGFVGMLFVVAAFAAYGWLGFRIAQSARTRFQQLVAIGIATTIVITAFVHLGVVIGLLPTTGLTLPFISDGRSNLLLSFAMTGILVNIGSVREKVYGEAPMELVPQRSP